MIEEMESEIVIIGAGVVGLSIARALALQGHKDIMVVDRHPKFGFEASSHNSEVIHAGIYYTPDSLKAKSCVAGRKLLYEFCEAHDVPYLKCGKFIVVDDESRAHELDAILEKGKKNGVHLEKKNFPHLAHSEHLAQKPALWSPDSGIVDSHQFMLKLEAQAVQLGVSFLYQHVVQVLEAQENSIQLELIQGEEKHRLKVRKLINAGGLGAAKILKDCWPQSPWSIRPCRGRYFGLSSRYQSQFPHLIYPLPDPRGGLGVHITMDIAGKVRLGPDVDWSKQNEKPDSFNLYEFSDSDTQMQEHFCQAGKKLIQDLKFDDLSPDYIGVRCKLFKNEIAHPEYEIVETPSAIHLLGIESPGLTSALALARAITAAVQS